MVDVYGELLFGRRVLPSWPAAASRWRDASMSPPGERHDVGLQAVDHRAGLLARAAVRLLDGDLVAGLLEPVGATPCCIRRRARASGLRNVQQFDVLCVSDAAQQSQRRCRGQCRGG